MQRFVLLVLGMALGVVAHAQDVRGTVLEIQDSKRAPSAGAFVIVHWVGRRPGLFHYEPVCIQAAIARTDGQGRFEIAEPPPLRSTFLVFRDAPAAAIYKPGFDERSELRVAGPAREWSLTPTRLDAPQRAAFVEAMADMGCHDDRARLIPLADPHGVLPAFRAALAAESGVKAPAATEIRVLPRPVPLPASP